MQTFGTALKELILEAQKEIREYNHENISQTYIAINSTRLQIYSRDDVFSCIVSNDIELKGNYFNIKGCIYKSKQKLSEEDAIIDVVKKMIMGALMNGYPTDESGRVCIKHIDNNE